ncbi:MAG: hypothetical protein WCG01_02205 [bacterium]
MINISCKQHKIFIGSLKEQFFIVAKQVNIASSAQSNDALNFDRNMANISKLRVSVIEKRKELKIELLKNRECKDLSKFFGKNIDVPELPAEATLENIQHWEKMEMELRYLPSIEMTEKAKLAAWKFRPYKEFYQMMNYAKLGIFKTKGPHIQHDSATLKGSWLLVDKRERPGCDTYNNHAGEFKNDYLSDIIKYYRANGAISGKEQDAGSRFNIEGAVFNNSDFVSAVAEKLKVRAEQVRLLRAIEFNVLGNMHYSHWGLSDSEELFSDETLDGYRLRGGRSIANFNHLGDISPCQFKSDDSFDATNDRAFRFIVDFSK